MEWPVRYELATSAAHPRSLDQYPADPESSRDQRIKKPVPGFARHGLIV
jgi:hypothetical protein